MWGDPRVGSLNQRVGGSSPPRPTNLFGRFPSIGSARNAFRDLPRPRRRDAGEGLISKDQV